MLQRKLCLFALLLMALSACQEDGDLAACGADDLQELVGQSPEMMGMVDVPMDARIIGPDTAVTQDFRPDRLNITYDADGVVTRVWCG